MTFRLWSPGLEDNIVETFPDFPRVFLRSKGQVVYNISDLLMYLDFTPLYRFELIYLLGIKAGSR